MNGSLLVPHVEFPLPYPSELNDIFDALPIELTKVFSPNPLSVLLCIESKQKEYTFTCGPNTSHNERVRVRSFEGLSVVGRSNSGYQLLTWHMVGLHF